ncbi:MAG: hypothetical protein K2N28_01850 [Muribaculaceae bacterium]|nr:hypothetical protein [Muribaculaceae bacterium]
MNHNLLETLSSLDPAAGGDGLAMLYPHRSEGAEILLGVRPDEYSAATIARAVEDCDSHLVNLSVTSARTPSGNLVVALRTDASSPDSVVRSLGRYGYEVLEAVGSGESVDEHDARARAAELLYLLDI